jgi:hypothetical protein
MSPRTLRFRSRQETEMNFKLALATAVTLASLLAAGTASASVPSSALVLEPIALPTTQSTMLVADYDEDWECEWDHEEEEFDCDWDDDDDDWDDDWDDDFDFEIEVEL